MVLININRLLLVFVYFHNVEGRREKKNTYDIEERLRTELLANYSAQQKPRSNLKIFVGLTILTVKELNIRDQSLSFSGYLRLEWEDKRLAWDTLNTFQDYDDIKFLYTTEKYLWRPPIIIENAIDGLAVISDIAIPMRITPNGRIIWNPVGIYRVSCQSDTRFYPMDTQICFYKISSWAYNSAEINLFFHKSHPVDVSFYVENGEWDLLSADPFREESDTRTGDQFSTITFSLKLRRRPLFHVGKTLFPVSIMPILIAAVFKLPVESGEKIGFSLTVLLSYAVYLSVITEDIPSSSKTVCYLSLYIIFILFLATIAVCCTTLVIDLRMRHDDSKIPSWLKRFTCKCLKRLAYLEQNCGCRKYQNSKSPELKKNINRIHAKRESIILCDMMNNETTPKRDSLAVPETQIQVENENTCDLTWMELAEVMDNFFFNLFLFLICVSTIIFYIIVIVGYFSAAA